MASVIRRAAGLGVAFAIAMGALVPTARAADPVLPPTMFVWEAPFVRTTIVDLAVVQQGGSGGAVVARRVSNDAMTTNGVLTNGVSVAESSTWALAPGADGPRTIHGQLQFADGTWSPVGTLSLELDTSPVSSFYADVDSAPFQNQQALHRFVTSDDVRMFGWGYPHAAPTTAGFRVSDGQSSVSLFVPEAPLTPGTYTSTGNGDMTCGPVCAGVSSGNVSCAAGGSVTVHEIEFHPSGDVAVVSADFRLTCLPDIVLSGSVRYGSARDIVALAQDTDALVFGQLEVGEISPSQMVSITNIGTVPTTLGNATFGGAGATDYSVVEDGCADATLSVGEACEVTIVFEPSVRGSRQARLEIPDETSRGSRFLRLFGSATQPTTLSLSAPEVPEFGPAEATIDVTVSPAGPGHPRLFVNGVQQFGPTGFELTNPSRRVERYLVMLPPGTHELAASYEGIEYMESSTTDPISVTVGTETTLELSTSTDDGVAAGESAQLAARVWSGGPLSGTLRIRDDDSNEIIATASVSGEDPILTHAVSRGLGSHPYSAEFVPDSGLVQSASDTYDLEVVAGPRPATEMPGGTLYSTFRAVEGTFSTPTPGASFQCRYGDSDHWFTCTSPYAFERNREGTFELFVRARLPNGLADRTPATRLWMIDSTPPVASVPTKRFVTGSAISSGRVPLRVTWSGSDADSGVSTYRLDQGTDGGAMAAAATGLRTPLTDRGLTTQHSYRFGGRALDRAGNLSAGAIGPTFTLTRYIESSSRIRYSGTWRTTSSSVYWGGVTRYASTAGAMATFTSTGRAIAWVARKGPTRGKAEIFVNGTRVATVDLYASTYQNQRVVWSTSWSTAARRTITIRVVGTSGRPRVDMDTILTMN